jgi:hypothetical protein
MALPAWNESGLLPPGAHRADLPDIYDRFVLDAPGRDHRELLFSALTTHLRLIQMIIPAGVAWIDGSFATHREMPPEDVDVVVHPNDWTAVRSLPAEARAHLHALLTLRDVSIAEPEDLWFSRLQPVGGLIDAYLCWPGHEATWHETWSRVTDAKGVVMNGRTKGYAEVVW